MWATTSSSARVASGGRSASDEQDEAGAEADLAPERDRPAALAQGRRALRVGGADDDERERREDVDHAWSVEGLA